MSKLIELLQQLRTKAEESAKLVEQIKNLDDFPNDENSDFGISFGLAADNAHQLDLLASEVFDLAVESRDGKVMECTDFLRQMDTIERMDGMVRLHILRN